MKPVTLEQLIGGPLRALLLGQGIAAKATSQFIAEVGFEQHADQAERTAKEPKVRTFDFTYNHPVPDPDNPGGYINTPVQISIPLLTLTPIPNIHISEATVNFQANVIDMKPSEAKPADFALKRESASAPDADYHILAVYSTPRAGTDAEKSADGTLSISLKVVREPHAEGLTRVLNILQDAITSRTVKKPEK